MFCIILGLGEVKISSGPSAAARKGQGAERRGYDRLGGRALQPNFQLYPCVTCTKLMGGEWGGDPKNRIIGNYRNNLRIIIY